MGSAYTLRAGGSGGKIDRGTDVWQCGTSGAHPRESECPNDALYTPAEATGGYQAWGVGTTTVVFGSTTVECFLEPVLVWDISGQYQIDWRVVCRTVVVTSPTRTVGMAIARVEWGDEVVGTSIWGNVPTSLLAFRESLISPCMPIFNPRTTEADCAGGFNSAYVSDSGYEIDIVIDDPACDIVTGKRSGDSSDKSNGCFTYYQHTQVSNLPAAYKDTTQDDDESTLSIGFGSASGVSIAPGATYIVRQFFSSNAQPDMSDKAARHIGTVTTEFDTLCLGGVLEPAFCFFSVDIASVGGDPDTFTIVPVP